MFYEDILNPQRTNCNKYFVGPTQKIWTDFFSVETGAHLNVNMPSITRVVAPRRGNFA